MGRRQRELTSKTMNADVETTLQLMLPRPSNLDKRTYVPTEADRLTVMILCTIGASIRKIAMHLRLSEATLKKHYSYELEQAKTAMNVAIVNSLFQKAIRGDTQALIFWCKTQLGWKETHVQEFVLPTISLVAMDGSVVRTVDPNIKNDDGIVDTEFEEVEDDSGDTGL
jgi:uncharacterized membrane protein